MKKIYIDPGHGGSDSGALGRNGERESGVNLAVAKQLKTALLRHGYAVEMCRVADVAVSLEKRPIDANKFGADIYISLHANWSDNGAANGVETFVYKFGGEAEKIAKEVQRRLVEQLGAADRKVKEENLYVLRKTDMPAILVELGFMSNIAEVKLLTEPMYQKAAAEAICHGVCDYLKDTYVEEVRDVEFKDSAKVSNWAKEAVDKISDAGIMLGDDLGNFNPQAPITREEFAVAMVRALKL